MLGAYGWAFMKLIPKLYYNMTITAVSVVVALVVGGLETLNLIGDQLGLSDGGGFWGRSARSTTILASSATSSSAYFWPSAGFRRRLQVQGLRRTGSLRPQEIELVSLACACVPAAIGAQGVGGLEDCATLGPTLCAW